MEYYGEPWIPSRTSTPIGVMYTYTPALRISGRKWSRKKTLPSVMWNESSSSLKLGLNAWLLCWDWFKNILINKQRSVTRDPTWQKGTRRWRLGNTIKTSSWSYRPTVHTTQIQDQLHHTSRWRHNWCQRGTHLARREFVFLCQSGSSWLKSNNKLKNKLRSQKSKSEMVCVNSQKKKVKLVLIIILTTRQQWRGAGTELWCHQFQYCKGSVFHVYMDKQ